MLNWLRSHWTEPCAVAAVGRECWFLSPTEPPFPLRAEGLYRGAALLCVAEEAVRMEGRYPDKPARRELLVEGVFRDEEGATALLATGLSRFARSRLALPPLLATGRFDLPHTAAATLCRLLRRAGAGPVRHLPFVVCCAAGLGLSRAEPALRGILAIEADWCSFAAVSPFGIACEITAPIGLLQLVETARWNLYRTKEILFHPDLLAAHLRTRGLAEGSALRGWERLTDQVRADREVEIHFTPEELQGAASPGILQIADAVREALLQLAPDPLDELRTQGITLCGEGALVQGLAAALEAELALPIHAHPEAIHPAAAGLARLLQDVAQLI